MKIDRLVKNILLACVLMPSLAQADDRERASEPFAVVELFASEGCASCPPADAFLIRLADQARREKLRVFPLSFQVDYWNHLGWEDPFSTAAFTRRQHDYADRLGTKVYTPQIVVNGRAALVGSREDEVRRAIADALTAPAQVPLTLAAQADGEGGVEAFCTAYGTLPPHTVLNVALVEHGVTIRATAGENEGRWLKHDNLVREFRTVDFDGKQARVSFVLPEDGSGDYSVIAYAQNAADLSVLGAAMADTAP